MIIIKFSHKLFIATIDLKRDYVVPIFLVLINIYYLYRFLVLLDKDSINFVIAKNYNREYADFFSFGTNDMTQMGFGLSRDDADKFIPDYLNTEIFVVSPFESLDRQGIGRFVELGFKNGKLGNATQSNSAMF